MFLGFLDASKNTAVLVFYLFNPIGNPTPPKGLQK